MNKPDILILYGSQTGNAELEAKRLAADFCENDLNFRLFECDSYDFTNLLDEKFVIIMASTSGQGDPPHNMKEFFDNLMIDFPSDVFSQLKFSIFGFGDSTYQKYNKISRVVQKRLLNLGAREFLSLALGDDSQPEGYFKSLIQWKKDILAYFGKPYSIDNELGLCSKYLYDIAVFDDVESNSNVKNTLDHDYYCSVINNTLITAKGYEEKVYELEVKLENPLDYRPGDIASIYYANSDEAVECLLKILDKQSTYIQISLKDIYKQIKKDLFLDKKINLRHALKHLFDISKPPNYYFFKSLSSKTKDILYKEKIDEMTYEDYYDYIVKEKRKIWEICYDFKIEHISLYEYINNATVIKPRDYSIACSSLRNSRCMRFIYNYVKYKTSANREIYGLCTSFLTKLMPSDFIAIKYHKNVYSYIADENPKIIIATGTGLAPFLALLEEMESKDLLNSQKHVVIFGCRYESKDFLYKDYLKDLDSKNKIKLFTAFSRDTTEKIYVQHILQYHKRDYFKEYLKENLSSLRIHVCGNSKFLPISIEK